MKSHAPHFRVPALRTRAFVLALLAAAALPASAQVFDAPDADFKGKVSAATPLVLPGKPVELSGQGFKPGQRVTLQRGATVLNPQPYVAGQDGTFKGSVALPADTVPGQQPIILNVANPSAAAVFELKVSPEIPLSGQDRFATRSEKLAQGLYQVAYSAGSDRLFVTSAVGRPPVRQSQLLKINPKTLKVEKSVTPAKVPGHDDGRVFAVYGVGVDDVNGHVWVTNTRDNTVAVYRQSDLSLVKQFDPGTVPHARDVLVDAKRGKVYATATGEDHISVFDAARLEHLKEIQIPSKVDGEKFVPMSLALDAEAGKLFTPSIGTSEAVVIDAGSDSVEKLIALPNARSASGIAYDARGGRLFVVSQGSDNLLIVDAASGRTLHDVAVGGGALNVGYDPANDLVYVASRAAGTITVVDKDGKVVANLDGGTYPNHLQSDGHGVVYAVNKSRGADDPSGDRITRIAPKKR